MSSATSRDAADQGTVDFAYLARQTFGDADLQREVLDLFVEQAKRVLASLTQAGDEAQRDAAHLLLGSALGVGAWAAAEAAGDYERREPSDRAIALPQLRAVFAQAVLTIEARLQRLESFGSAGPAEPLSTPGRLL